MYCKDWIRAILWYFSRPCALLSVHLPIREMASSSSPPVYLLYARAIDRCGRNLVNNPLVYKGDHWEMDFVDLEEKMSRPENKLMLLCNPHNPTMDVWEKKDLERVARLAAKYHVLVVVDEIYAEHVWEEGLMVPYGALSDAEHNCIVCTSLGKSFNFTGTSHANIIIPG